MESLRHVGRGIFNSGPMPIKFYYSDLYSDLYYTDWFYKVLSGWFLLSNLLITLKITNIW